MGLLDRFFSKPAEKHIEVKLDAIEEFVQQNTQGASQERERAIANRFAEIKHALKRVQESVSALTHAPIENENKRAIQVVSTARDNLIRQLTSLITRLQPPATPGLVEAKAYVEQSLSLLEKEGKMVGKNIAYTRALLQEQSKLLATNMQEMDQSLGQLKKYVNSQSNVFAIEQLLSEKNVLKETKQQVYREQQSLEELETQLESLAKQHEIPTGNIATLQTSPSFSTLTKIEETQAALLQQKQKIFSNIQTVFLEIDKPVRRFQSLVQAERVFLKNAEHKELLSLLLSDPVTAVKRDPEGAQLKAVLGEIVQGIDNNTISLKPKEVEKKRKQVETVMNTNFADSFFWKINEIEKQLSHIDKELGQNTVKADIEKEMREQQRITEEIAHTNNQLQKTREKIEQQKSEIREQHAALEQQLQQAFGANITLVNGD